MNLFSIQQNFNTKAKCIHHLEKVRWNNDPVCPHCNSANITPRKNRKFFYHCNKCNKDFTVLKGTIFEASKMPLPKWFLLIRLMLNARKGMSSMELHRNLGTTYKTAWYSAMRVRCAMVDEVDMLEGIIEMDEAYVGGKPRHRGKKDADNVANLSTVTRSKPGRGTKKVPVVAIVEREGKKRVVTEVSNQLSSRNMLAMLKRYVNTERAIAMTDESNIYNQFEKELQHLIVTHSKGEYSRGIVSTNTVEGFFSIIKNGIRGEFHVLSKKYLPFYLAEFTYKYNRRSKEQKETAFDETVEKSVIDDKCLVKYKPKKDVAEITYSKKTRKKTSKKHDCKFGELSDKKQKKEKRVKKSAKKKTTKKQPSTNKMAISPKQTVKKNKKNTKWKLSKKQQVAKKKTIFKNNAVNKSKKVQKKKTAKRIKKSSKNKPIKIKAKRKVKNKARKKRGNKRLTKNLH